MSYSDITFKDRNPLKRWLQNERLNTAIRTAGAHLSPTARACDFGAGNGELCKLLANRSFASVVCYEPAAQLLQEARDNLAAHPHIVLTSSLADLPRASQNVVFCLEVFEHLPPEESSQALHDIEALLAPGGVAVIGVPVEVGVPALYKGLFRMARRPGDFDAGWRNVLAALRGQPPTERPLTYLTPELRFHPHHLGFDFRSFQLLLAKRFDILATRSSPVALGPALMPEIYFLLAARTPPAQ
jgi:SAM-dependent methyltransferase